MEAGIADTAAFAECVSTDQYASRIESALRLGQAWRVDATPTVMVNGWRFRGGPRDSLLVKTIRDVIAGKDPV